MENMEVKKLSELNAVAKNKNTHKACGILFCYNEGDIIKKTLQYYLEQGIDLVVFDNQSTDSTIDIVKSFYRENNKYVGKLLDLVFIQTKGYEQYFLMKQANDYMHRKLNNYKWIMVIDADEHYVSPIRNMSLLDYLDLMDKFKYNIIHGRAYHFYPTEKDDSMISDYTKRMNYCQVLNKYPQEKIFSYHSSVNFYIYGGHCCLRNDRRVCMNPGFIMKHYGWISYEQGVKKVFKNRIPRYTNDQPVQNQYAYMLPVKSHFIKDSNLLLLYDEEKEVISVRKFFWITKIIRAYDLIFNKFSKIMPVVLRPYSAKPPIVSAPPGPRPVPYYVLSNIIDKIMTPSLKNSKVKYEVNAPPLTYPSKVFFLMTNFCNARCVFCNQPESKKPSEITLDKFKKMISHMPMQAVSSFTFSGGGEPLLCKDLFAIMKYVNDFFPHVQKSIRTNGLLIGKFAKEIAESNINNLEISVHGMEEVNDGILQTSRSSEIFKGLALLKDYQKEFDKKIFKRFCPVVSNQNIYEIPKLIQKAAELGVDEVDVASCIYYPHRIGEKLKPEDSAFFHRQTHDKVIKESTDLAKKLGVNFAPTRLYSKPFKGESFCCFPWNTILVDWDGDVYPCPGGEARFFKKVKSGAYHFGNLINEDVSNFWVNDLYTKLRRHLSFCKDSNVPECNACHLAICHNGPAKKENHIIPDVI